MKTCILRALALSALVASAVLVGCQQTQSETNAPGALPGRSAAQTPRLSATTIFAHAHLLERQGEFARAAVQYRRALETVPDFIAARNRLGITLNKMGRHSEATQEFLVILETNPNLAFVRNNLGFSYYLEGNYAAAEAEFTRALEMKPDFTRARMNRGVAQAKLARWSEALEDFKAACSESDAYFNLGMVQSEAGFYADAARSLELALRVNPKLDVARVQLHEVARLAALQEQAQREAQAVATIEMHDEDGDTLVMRTDDGASGQLTQDGDDHSGDPTDDDAMHTTESHMIMTDADNRHAAAATDDMHGATPDETMEMHGGHASDTTDMTSHGTAPETHADAPTTGSPAGDDSAFGADQSGALFLPTDFFPGGTPGNGGLIDTGEAGGLVLGATAEAWTPDDAGFTDDPAVMGPTGMGQGDTHWDNFGVTSEGLTPQQSQQLSMLMGRFIRSLLDCPERSNDCWSDVQMFLTHTTPSGTSTPSGGMMTPEVHH